MSRIVLYDDTCCFCKGLTGFLKREDRDNRLILVPLMSEEGRRLLKSAGLAQSDSDTAVYLTDGRFYFRSSAVLYILKDLGRLWQLLYILIIIPPFIRDNLYKVIARNRYRFSGSGESCKIY
jgi:predicted DCC family thiol-disulfide oxidoreductase YuxK